jgi:hypothetical protein
MPKCPYCSKELSLRLSAQFLSEIDAVYEEVLDKYIEQMPGVFKGWLRSQLKQRLYKYPTMVEMLVCVECDSVIHASVVRQMG